MAPKLQGTLSLFTAPAALRIPRSIAECSTPHQGSGSSRQYPYFTSGDLESDKAVIFLGGLTNGMGAVPYVHKLSQELGTAGWRLVQPHWTSAYDGYGTSSLDIDVAEIGALVDHIRKEDGIKKVVIMGHSTGSQDVIHYLTSPSDLTSRPPVEGGIMQAPASDREYFSGGDDSGINAWLSNLPIAEQMMKDGKGDQVMDATACEAMGIRITAYRLWSLLSEVGDDDYFSFRIPIESDGVHPHPLNSSFGKLPVPTLALFSSADAAYQTGDVKEKLKKWEGIAQGKLTTRYIDGASHGVVEPEAQEIMCKEVVDWLATITN